MQIIAATLGVMGPVVLPGGLDALWDRRVVLPTLIWAHFSADWQDQQKKLAGWSGPPAQAGRAA